MGFLKNPFFIEWNKAKTVRIAKSTATNGILITTEDSSQKIATHGNLV
jgi:hypothetical protein